MKIVIPSMFFLFLCSCTDDVATRRFKEYPVCTVVLENIPCREGEMFFPLGWGSKYHYHYRDKLYHPP